MQNGTFKIGTKHHFPRRYTEVVVLATWGVLLIFPLVYFLLPTILAGPWILQLSLVAVIVLGEELVRGILQ